MSRIKRTKHVFGEDTLTITPEMKRFATPEIVARYRAERLACNTIVDLCSGYGFQAFAFAQTCKHVIGVEKNPDAVAASRKFAEKLGLKNVTFLCGDVLSSEIFREISLLDPAPDIIFCDPQRAPAEKERRVETIQPDVNELLALYGKITPNIAIELPPHISNTAFDAEYEYFSLDGALNRLTLYFGKQKLAEKRLVLLPQKTALVADTTSVSLEIHKEIDETQSYTYLLEPNPVLLLTKMYKEAFAATFSEQQLSSLLQSKELIQIHHGKKTFFLSTVPFSSPFFVSYKIMERVPSQDGALDKQKILRTLKEIHAGKVLLRYALDPQHYWSERNFFEKQLSGDKLVHLFFFDVALICEKFVS